VHCFSRSVDTHLCFSAMNPVSRPVFVTYVRVQAHVPDDDEYRARFRCSLSAKGSEGEDTRRMEKVLAAAEVAVRHVREKGLEQCCRL
jgi:hypothetical protein